MSLSEKWEWITSEKHPHHQELVQKDGLELGLDSILYHGSNWPMTEAHKCLIAAAPELLKALQALTEWLADDSPSKELVSNAEWVIAKATEQCN